MRLNVLFSVKKDCEFFRLFKVFIAFNERREFFYVFVLIEVYKFFKTKNVLFKF